MKSNILNVMYRLCYNFIVKIVDLTKKHFDKAVVLAIITATTSIITAKITMQEATKNQIFSLEKGIEAQKKPDDRERAINIFEDFMTHLSKYSLESFQQLPTKIEDYHFDKLTNEQLSHLKKMIEIVHAKNSFMNNDMYRELVDFLVVESDIYEESLVLNAVVNNQIRAGGLNIKAVVAYFLKIPSDEIINDDVKNAANILCHVSNIQFYRQERINRVREKIRYYLDYCDYDVGSILTKEQQEHINLIKSLYTTYAQTKRIPECSIVSQ